MINNIIINKYQPMNTSNINVTCQLCNETKASYFSENPSFFAEFNLIGNHFIVTYYFRLTCILEQTIELNTVCNNITENIVIECGTLLFTNICNWIYLTT